MTGSDSPRQAYPPIPADPGRSGRGADFTRKLRIGGGNASLPPSAPPPAMTGKRDGRAVSADQDRLDAIAASEVFLDAPDVLVDDVQDVLVDVGDGTLIQAILAIGGDPAGMTSSELYEVASAILSSAPRAVTETFRAHLGAHGRFA